MNGGLTVGVVATRATDRPGRRCPNGTSYLVCGEGRATWLEDGSERAAAADGAGWLLALIAGDGVDEEACRSASLIARVVAKLWQHGEVRDRAAVVASFLMDAHTRLYWRAKAQRPQRPAGSVFVGWCVDGQLAWAQVGAMRAWLAPRDPASGAVGLQRLGAPWPAGDLQRFIGGSRGLGDDTAIHIQRDVNAGVASLAPGDRLVIGTEALWRSLDEASLAHVLRHTEDPQAAAVTCLERARVRGATDAIAALVAGPRAG